jgi:chromosome segregation ATPase
MEAFEEDSKVRSEIAKIDNELERIQQDIEELLKRQEELGDRKEYLQEQLNENKVFLQSKSKDWSLRNFEWSEKIEDLRGKVFHIDEFRPLQLECMNVTMSGTVINCISVP